MLSLLQDSGTLSTDPTREKAVCLLDVVLDVKKPGGGTGALVSVHVASLKTYELFFVISYSPLGPTGDIGDTRCSDDPLLLVFLNTPLDPVPLDKKELSSPRTGEYPL
jgi:hypothetical protein